MKYLAPVGTADERALGKVPPGKWVDATGYAKRYRIGTPAEAYHTGCDFNLNSPVWDEDAHKPIFAIADGVVTCAREFDVWGQVVVIDHGEIMTRYAHMERMDVLVGQQVKQGQQIALIGNANGTQAYHLHYDVSHTRILASKPSHWPKLDLDALKANYLDPVLFHAAQGTPQEPEPMTIEIKRVTDYLNMRASASSTAARVELLPPKANVVVLTGTAPQTSGGFTWLYVDHDGKRGWTATKWLEDFR